jgi:hypothetical protein
MLSRLLTSVLFASSCLMAIRSGAQTIIQNERLVNTTLVVITEPPNAACFVASCQTVSVKIGCSDTVHPQGCKMASHHGTMRVDAFDQ